MIKAVTKFRKLRGRSLEELRVRGAQWLAVCGERQGWSAETRVPHAATFIKLFDPARLPTPSRVAISVETFSAGLLQHFRARTLSSFFAGFSDREETLEALGRRFAEEDREVIQAANKIAEGRFDLLGCHDLSFGDPINWHLEPIAGKETPRAHWSRINYLDPNVAGDKKITWELNRHQYFLTLGRAYWRTGDERYAQTFAAHLASWMAANPPKLGINWASSLEVAFRAIAWLWALYFFKDSPALAPQLFAEALKFLYLHARHIETHLSTYFSPNTHLTGEALGLYYLGTLLPEFRASARWRETGREILLRELDRHVRPDGVYFEQSTYYHRYTADFYTHFLILSRASGDKFESELEDKLQLLLDHLMYITRPDGTTPFFGDDDGGRLISLDNRPRNDFRSTLATGAALFGRADYKHAANSAAEETLWLLGPHGLAAFDNLDACPPETASRAFPDGGYYVMRDGWTSDANYMLIDCGPHGAMNCGHAHSDALHFDLAACGRTLLVDPGTYTYTGSNELRDWFRSSAAHNTLTINNESSSVPDGCFTWRHIAESTARSWISRKRFDFFEGEHNGYERLVAPSTHRRSVLFLKRDYWIVRDRVLTIGKYAYRLHFHFAIGTTPETEVESSVMSVREPGGRLEADAPMKETCAEMKAHDASLQVCAFGSNRKKAGQWHRAESWVSPCYGAHVSAPILSFSAIGEGNQEFVSFLMPHKVGSPAHQVREVAATGGQAFEVSDEQGWRDLVAINHGSTIETARLTSDAQMSWVRFSDETGKFTEIALIGGSWVKIDQEQVVSAAKPFGFMTARLVDGEWQVETDAGVELTVSLSGARRIVVNEIELSADVEKSVSDNHEQSGQSASQ